VASFGIKYFLTSNNNNNGVPTISGEKKTKAKKEDGWRAYRQFRCDSFERPFILLTKRRKHE
jgi:hypothetical protein